MTLAGHVLSQQYVTRIEHKSGSIFNRNFHLAGKDEQILTPCGVMPFDRSVLFECSKDQVFAWFRGDSMDLFRERVHLFHVGLVVITSVDSHKHT